MIEPKGIPITNDTVSPPVIVEIARPRSSGGAHPAATALPLRGNPPAPHPAPRRRARRAPGGATPAATAIAVGVNAAAPHAASARQASRSPKVGAKTAAALARANTPIAAPRPLRRATPHARATRH